MLNNQITFDNSNKLAIQTENTKYAYMKPHNKHMNKSTKNNSNNRQHLHKRPSLPTNNEQQEENNRSLLTPPSSPEAIPISTITHQYTNKKKVSSTYEYNNRILAAKRNGNIRVVMNEFISMKKNNVQMTHHTYNLVLESHAILRREGTPLTTMLKSKYQ